MADVTIKQGNRLPKLARQFLTDLAATDLTGTTVTFNMWNASTGAQVISNGAVTFLNAVLGTVEYAWTEADATLPVGNYLSSFTASYAGGTKLMTAPNDGMISVEIFGATSSDWSYTGNPGARLIDKVRFLIGDTDIENALIKDGEITFLLGEWDNSAYLAAQGACDSLGAKFASKSDTSKSVGDLSLSTSYGEQAQRWRDQAEALRTRSASASPPKPAVYKDEKGNIFGPTNFRVGMSDNLS